VTGLIVPARVTQALAIAVGLDLGDPQLNELGYALFAPVVAAELRRLADEPGPVARVASVWLTGRADYLDPGGAQ
jgi:hypothetical protein